MQDSRLEPRFEQVLCGQRGRLDVEAHFVETAYQGDGLYFVLVRDTDKDSAVIAERHTGSNHGFEDGAMEFPVIADGLARGFHLRGEIGVHAAEFGEGEGRDFDIVT